MIGPLYNAVPCHPGDSQKESPEKYIFLSDGHLVLYNRNNKFLQIIGETKVNEIRVLAEEIGARIIDKAQAKYITDFGRSFEAIDQKSGEKVMIPRYGVWGDLGKGKDEVLDSSNSLPYLKRKWEIENVIPWK